MRRALSLLIVFSLLVGIATTAQAQRYPRIANLWACGPPQATDYDSWARHSLLVMTGDSSAQWRKFAAEVRHRNSDIILLGTAPLMNIYSLETMAWMKDEWYVRRPNGDKVSWWADQNYVPNLMIDTCLDALVQWTEKKYGEILADGTVSGMFYDSVVGRVSWYGEVDLDCDGKADLAADVDPKWQARQNLFFDRLRQRWPKMLILANDVDLGHAPHVNGRLFEGAPLLDRVPLGALSPKNAAQTLQTWMTTSVQPGITFCLASHPMGWQGWRVGKDRGGSTPGEAERARRDYSRMRLGLLTALMSDAHFAYDFGTVWYGLPWWYAEYDAPLGKPLGAAKEVFEVQPVTLLAWTAGQPTNAFKVDSSAKVSPAGIEGQCDDSKYGWQRLFATDPATVRFEPGRQYRIEADCQIIKSATGSLQFNVRTPTGGWEQHDKGVCHPDVREGHTWHMEVTIVPDDYDDYAAEWHLNGAGQARLTKLKILQVDQSYLVREFEGGLAVLNSTPRPITVNLKRRWRRLKDAEAPRHVVEVDDSGPGFSRSGAWEVIGGEAHHYGETHRQTPKPGSSATWKFIAPSTDDYTIFVTVPRDKGLTDAAAYKISSGGRSSDVTASQAGGDGWVKLTNINLTSGQPCTITLLSGGTGVTVADAIRAESAARLNDGSTVTKLELGPLDGTILLRSGQ